MVIKPSIPILMYHEVGPKGAISERYTVTINSFLDQLAYLRDHGYRTMSLHDCIGLSDRAKDSKGIVITFDDNNVSHYTISTERLAKFGFSATFFVVSGFVDTGPDLLTAQQLREMQGEGMSVQSHSHTHRFLSDLDGQSLRNELTTSKQLLEQLLSRDVDFVSCPGGRCSRKVLVEADASGYRGVCTSEPGLNDGRSGRKIRPLNRFLVSATTSLEDFGKMVSGDENFVWRQVAMYNAKTLAKRALGNRLYDTLWQRFVRNLSA